MHESVQQEIINEQHNLIEHLQLMYNSADVELRRLRSEVNECRHLLSIRDSEIERLWGVTAHGMTDRSSKAQLLQKNALLIEAQAAQIDRLRGLFVKLDEKLNEDATRHSGDTIMFFAKVVSSVLRDADE